MGKMYIQDNIEKLRQQRDDKVKDGYRYYAFKIFIYIKKGIALSKTDYCNPKYSDISKAVYGNRNEESKVRSFIKDLKKSGYITVYGVGPEKEIKILKDIDF